MTKGLRLKVEGSKDLEIHGRPVQKRSRSQRKEGTHAQLRAHIVFHPAIISISAEPTNASNLESMITSFATRLKSLYNLSSAMSDH